MSEPSNVPPLWSTAYVAGLTGGLLGSSKDQDQETAQDTTPPWQVTFPQPASDYLAFRRKLDQNSVSLENVIVRESEQCLVGTVKVRNLAYDKEVVVRASSDCWSTHEDVYCTYVEQPGSPGPLILYDTFRFRLTLPVASDIVEFCVRYRTDGKESWDNNENKNYLVRKKQEVCFLRYDTHAAYVLFFFFSNNSSTLNLLKLLSASLEYILNFFKCPVKSYSLILKEYRLIPFFIFFLLRLIFAKCRQR